MHNFLKLEIVRGSFLLMSKKVQAEREAQRKRRREEADAAEMEQALKWKEDLELKTLLEIAELDQNPEAAKDKILDDTFHYALGFDLLACYLHSEHGFPAPMVYDEEKRRLKEMNPKFKVPLKIDGDQ